MVANTSYDPVREAAKYALNLYEALKGASVQEREGRLEAPGLYSRSRGFPSLLAHAGLAPSTAFVLSKAESPQAVEAAFKAMKGEKLTGEDARALVQDATSTGKGYAIMAGIIARVLVDSGFCTQSNQRVDLQLASCASTLAERGDGEALVAESILLATLQEFKKYVEAFTAKPRKEE